MKNLRQKFKDIWIKFWGIIFFIGVSINFLEIVCRTLFHFSWDIMYDLPVWLTIWSVMMLAGPILPDGDHVSVDMIRDNLHGTARKILECFNLLVCIIFGLIITYGGYLVVMQYYKFNMNIIRVISVPRFLVESCIPIGMGLFTIFAIIHIFRVLRTDYKKLETKDK